MGDNRVEKIMKQILRSFKDIIDLESYRQLQLELSMFENIIDCKCRESYLNGVRDSIKVLEDRLHTFKKKDDD